MPVPNAQLNDSRDTCPYDGLPPELIDLTQWVAWRRVPEGTKVKKPPIDPKTGLLAHVTDPSTWASMQAAADRCRRDRLAGIGFVFTDDDPYVGIDLDGCMDRDTGAVEPWAQVVVDHMRSYTELSPSGTGLHIIARAQLPDDCPHVVRPREWGGRQIEVYDRGRFFTMTGLVYVGAGRTISDRQDAAEVLLDALEATRAGTACSARSDRGRLLARALLDRRMASYLLGDTSEKGGNESQAEQSLFWQLALAIDARQDSPEDVERIATLARLTGLAGLPGRREKWARPDYLPTSIAEAIRFAYEKGHLPCRRHSAQSSSTPTSPNGGAGDRLMLTDLAPLLSVPSLKPATKIAAMAVLLHLEPRPPGAWVRVNREVIGKTAGLDRRRVTEAIDALRTFGVIEVRTTETRTGGQARTLTDIRLTGDWRQSLADINSLHVPAGRGRGTPLTPIKARSGRTRPAAATAPASAPPVCSSCGGDLGAPPGAKPTLLRPTRAAFTDTGS